jgi:enoyl-CoA hydratase
MSVPKVAQFVSTKMHGAVAVVTINRPKLNPLNDVLGLEIWDALHAADTNPAVGCIVLTGEGQAFVAGADIKQMADKQFVDWHKGNMFEPLDRIRTVKKPIIAAVNGFALGGGCELAMCCDIIVASEKAIFGQPEIKLGTIPGMGGTQRLTGLIGKSKAMEWVLTGNQYSAVEAEQAGLVARVFKHEDLLSESIKMGQTIAGYSQVTTALAKEAVNASLEMSLAQGLAYEQRVFQSTFATKDQKEGMSAFAEKRAPAFKNE